MSTTLETDLELEAAEGEEARVHEWRVDQLWRLGIPRLLAAEFAGGIDWHDVAKLVERGCPALLALEIAR
jgi:hypothetical protein